MGLNYKKAPSIKSATLRAKPSGASKFPHVTSPRNAPLKTRIYTKASAQKDPSEFSDFGFGATGLAETPSIMGMAQKVK